MYISIAVAGSDKSQARQVTTSSQIDYSIREPTHKRSDVRQSLCLKPVQKTNEINCGMKAKIGALRSLMPCPSLLGEKSKILVWFQRRHAILWTRHL